jgi:hypothetical protein
MVLRAAQPPHGGTAVEAQSVESLVSDLSAAQHEIARLRRAGECHDVVAMSLGAVMALHAVDELTATTALARVAAHRGVAAVDVARALLWLVSSLSWDDDPIGGETAGRAAAQLLAVDPTILPC